MSLLVKLGLAKETSAEIAARESASKPTPTIQVATPVAVASRTGGRRRASTTDDAEDTDTSSDSSVTTNKDVENRLWKAVYACAETGVFDYNKFITMIKKSKSLGEDGAYAAALSAAETMGASVEDLVASSQTVIKAVNTESKKIDADLAEQAEQNVTDQAELKKINSQISALETRKEALEKKIDSESSSIEDSQKSLEATVDLVIGDIRNVVSKIKKNSK